MHQGTLFFFGALSGSMIVFATVVVPGINGTLGAQGDQLLRVVFNRFQVLGFGLALGGAAMTFEQETGLAILFGMVALGFFLNRYVLTPRIDGAQREHIRGKSHAGPLFDRLLALSMRIFGYQGLIMLIAMSFLM